jgi:transcription factor WhiB
MTGFIYDTLTMALINLSAEGGRSICTDTAVKDLFLSEDAQERSLATRLCRLCPVQAECLAAAVANGERFGVFGGRDFSNPTAATVT